MAKYRLRIAQSSHQQIAVETCTLESHLLYIIWTVSHGADTGLLGYSICICVILHIIMVEIIRISFLMCSYLVVLSVGD